VFEHQQAIIVISKTNASISGKEKKREERREKREREKREGEKERGEGNST